MKKNIKISEHPILLLYYSFYPSLCHCEERSDAAIPSFHCIFHFFSVIASTALGARQSHLILLMSFPHRRESILCIPFCIIFYFFIISSLAYKPNSLFLHKLNTKYRRLTTYFNNYALFLCNILPFSATKTLQKLYFLYILLYLLYNKIFTKTL